MKLFLFSILRSSTVRIGTLAAAAGLTAGCGRPHADEHAGHRHSAHSHSSDARSAPVEVHFKAGTGLTFPPEIRQAIGLTTAPVDERAVAHTFRVQAQVIELGPPALAAVSVSAEQGAALSNRPLTGARLIKAAPQTSAPGSLVDLTLALDGTATVRLGDHVDLTLSTSGASPVTAIPRSALLRSASGTFVYVVNGGTYLRTAVVTGAESADSIEVVDGLYAGDEVVTHPVEQLWLIELRATKGGGHSH